jgi:CBS domain-containing protein
MTVARILAVKGRDVFTTQPHRTLQETARLLASKGIGAVVVTGADGQVLGIISERDIVRALAEGGAPALDDAVSSHMTSEVFTASSSTCIHDIMERMTHSRFRHVPVVEGERLAGLISIGDVVKHRIAEIETEHRALREYIATA